MTKNIFVLIILVFNFTFGQKEKLKLSNQYFYDLEYLEAQKLYLDIIENGYEAKDVYEKLGDTYYYNNDYSNANKWYAKVFEYEPSTISKSYYLKYIQTLKATNDYKQAKKLLDLYAKEKPKDQYVENYLNNPDYLQIINTNSGNYNIKNLEINTEFQDFGTTFLPNSNKIVYSSSRDSLSLTNRISKWNEGTFYNLFIAEVDTNTLELNRISKLDNSINTKFHESNAVFSKDANTIYFTRNNYIKKKYETSSDKYNKLKILKATRKNSNSKWENIVELPFNSNEYSTAHPALSPDGKKLFFASDRPGSLKSNDKLTSDIWYVNIDENGGFSEPINFKSVNTIGNDLFPFISENGDFYYSSNGNLGLGGLDIYKVTIDDKGFPTKEIVNLGTPINSSYDDFAFIVNDSLGSGYFSSNRKSGKGLDDIYSFKQIKKQDCIVTITGVVTNKETNNLASFVKLNLFDRNNNNIKTTTTKEDGSYSFLVECDEMYSIKADDDFNISEKFFFTPKFTSTLEKPLSLSYSNDNKSLNVKVGDDLKDKLNLNMIYFDLNKHNIKPESEFELQKVVNYLKANPDVNIDIRSHTDSRSSDSYNLKLSNKRADKTKSYLVRKGINADRITAKGYGESRLLNKCSNGVECTEDQHNLNRRSEFIILKK